MAFQLKDDWLDSFGNQEKFGKNIGGDIGENKKTFLYLRCLEIADDTDRLKLTSYFNDQKSEYNKIKAVLELYAKYNIREETLKEMEYYFSLSLDTLQKIQAPEKLKKEISEFAEWLYKRDY